MAKPTFAIRFLVADGKAFLCRPLADGKEAADGKSADSSSDHVVRKDLGTYVQLNIYSMSYYCWHHPWGEYVGRRNYKPLSFYLSSWNALLMCMRWVLAIIEDYMMAEYVDLHKGSDTWPFLKRWWIVVAKLTENIVCWFPIVCFILRCCDELLLIHEKSMIKVLCLSLLLL